MKIWQKNITVNKDIETFTVGKDRELDLQMAGFDVLGSLAHVEMLESIGLLTAEELSSIQAELKNIYAEIEAGNFRMDLYHRLNVINIHVPHLTERTDDIPVIAQQFLDEICGDYGMPVKKISDSAMEALKALPWTGNVRELHNMIERLIILSDKTITENDVIAFANPTGGTNIGAANGVPTPVAQGGSSINYEKFSNFQDYKDFAEKEFIKFKLEKNNWNVSKTADDIEIQRSHLYSKIEKFGLKRAE